MGHGSSPQQLSNSAHLRIGIVLCHVCVRPNSILMPLGSERDTGRSLEDDGGIRDHVSQMHHLLRPGAAPESESRPSLLPSGVLGKNNLQRAIERQRAGQHVMTTVHSYASPKVMGCFWAWL